MKEVRITLSDDQVAAIEAEVAAGEARSISEVIASALEVYLATADLPTDAEMVAELEAMRREISAGGRMLDPEDVQRMISDSLDE